MCSSDNVLSCSSLGEGGGEGGREGGREGGWVGGWEGGSVERKEEGDVGRDVSSSLAGFILFSLFHGGVLLILDTSGEAIYFWDDMCGRRSCSGECSKPRAGTAAALTHLPHPSPLYITSPPHFSEYCASTPLVVSLPSSLPPFPPSLPPSLPPPT